MIRKCDFSSLFKISDRGSRRLAAGFCAVFAVLALVNKLLDPTISRDGALYLEIVKMWQTTGNYEAVLVQFPDVVKTPPLLFFLIKSLAAWGIYPETAGVGLSMITGCTLPLLVYLLAQEVQPDRRISLAASLLTAFNPAMIELACEVQRDMLYVVFCGWSIFFAVKGLRNRLVWPWIPAGVFFACAAMVRYEALEMFSVLAGVFCILGFRKVLRWKKICQQCAVFAMVCMLTVTGLIFLMGLQNYLPKAYTRFATSRISVLKEKIIPVRKD